MERTTISPTSTAAGWASAQALVSAPAVGGIAIASRRSRAAASAAESRVDSMKSVAVNPGLTIVQRISGTSSWRSTSQTARAPALDAAYTA